MRLDRVAVEGHELLEARHDSHGEHPLAARRRVAQLVHDVRRHLVWVSGLGARVGGFGFRVSGFGFQVEDLGVGCRVQGVGHLQHRVRGRAHR